MCKELVPFDFGPVVIDGVHFAMLIGIGNVMDFRAFWLAAGERVDDEVFDFDDQRLGGCHDCVNHCHWLVVNDRATTLRVKRFLWPGSYDPRLSIFGGEVDVDSPSSDKRAWQRALQGVNGLAVFRLPGVRIVQPPFLFFFSIFIFCSFLTAPD
jgi:hypothetical protein